MGRRLILDTGVIVAFERANLIPSKVLLADDDVAIAAVTLAELKVGAKIADPTTRASRETSIARILEIFPVEDYTKTTSESHSDLLVHCRRTGKPRGAIDLIIAATALATSRSLVTLDEKADFGGLPGVSAIIP